MNGHNVQGCKKRFQIRSNDNDVSAEAAARESAVTDSVLNCRAADPAICGCLNNVERALRAEFGATNSSDCGGCVGSVFGCHCVSLVFFLVNRHRIAYICVHVQLQLACTHLMSFS